MDVKEKSDKKRQFDWRTVMAIGIGLLLGWLLIQLLNMGLIIAVLVVCAIFLPLIGLNGYRAWLILIAASMVGFWNFELKDMTIRIEQIALIILIIGWLPGLLTGKNRLHRVPLLLPIMGYIGVNFLSSALYAPDKGVSYRGSLLLTLYALMYVFSVIVLQEYPEKIKSAVRFLLIMGFLQAAYSLISLFAHYGGVNLGGITLGHIESAVSLQGSFLEPNLFAAFVAAVSLLFIAFLAGEKGVINRVWASVGLGFLLLALIFTYTRASWIGFLTGLILLIFIQSPQRNFFNPRTAAIAVTMILILLLVVLPFANAIASDTVNKRISNIFDFSGGSGEGRVIVQKEAIERWHNGVLLGNGTLSLPAIPPAGSWIYSSMLQALHDTGIIGMLLLLWFQIGVIIIILKGYINSKDPFFKAALAGFAAGSIALMIASQASSFLWLGFPWIYAGLAVAVAQFVAKNETRSDTVDVKSLQRFQ